MEAGCLIDINGDVLHWHTPENRTVVSLPDSRKLWDIFWENRETIQGFAHSHPGSGIPGPSHEDVTTFAAIEAATGKRFDWWITSSNSLIVARYKGPNKLTYETKELDINPPWLDELRQVSIDLQKEVQNDRLEYHPGQ